MIEFVTSRRRRQSILRPTIRCTRGRICGPTASPEVGVPRPCRDISVTVIDTVVDSAIEQRGPGQAIGRCPVCGAVLPTRASIRGIDRLLRSPGQFEVRTCETCGAGSTAPVVPASELGQFYRQGYASHETPPSGIYAKIVEALKRAQVAALLRAAPFSRVIPGEPGRALDVGCGRGDLAAGLVNRGWQVGGVEPSARAGAIAQRRGIQHVGATLETATLAKSGYDLIVFRHSLEHLPDPVGDLRRVQEVLRPGGHVVISVPNFSSWQRRLFGTHWFHLDLPRHRVHFAPSSLATTVRAAGLTPQMQFTSTSVLGLPASIQYALVGKCIAQSGARLRMVAALCCAIFPMTWVLDRMGGELDTLHIVAGRD